MRKQTNRLQPLTEKTTLNVGNGVPKRRNIDVIASHGGMDDFHMLFCAATLLATHILQQTQTVKPPTNRFAKEGEPNPSCRDF